MIGHLSDRMFEEVAYIAYHLHWPYEEVMSLDAIERRRWIREIAALNRRAEADALLAAEGAG